MGIRGKSVTGRSLWRTLLGVFCIALVVLSATMSVTHTHASGAADHADCSLCVSAHHSIQPTVSTDIVVTRIVWQAPVVEVQPDLKFRFVAFSLWNRPPPEGLTHS